jgi:hypothetical protein
MVDLGLFCFQDKEFSTINRWSHIHKEGEELVKKTQRIEKKLIHSSLPNTLLY